MPKRGYASVVLVTGYPSFQARALVSRILREEPSTLVYAVVKGALREEAVAAQETLTPSEAERLVLLDGDAAHMDLGLSGEELRELAGEVDRIHHVAAVTYLGADRKLAEAVNVGGTREILEVAGLFRHLRVLVHHSTAFVSGDRRGVVTEDELQEGQRFRNVIEETRARAEKLVQEARARLPIAVLRPSMVVGDSATGEVERLDGPYLLVLLILSSPADLAIPLPGRGDAPLHLVPVDHVVEVAHLVGRDGASSGRTYHVVDPEPLTAREVFGLVAKTGGRRGPRGFLPANLTRALLHTPGLDRMLKSPRTFLEQLVTDVRYDRSNTERLLSGTGVTCPGFESYVDKLVQHVKARVDDEREKKRPAQEAEVEDPLS